MRIPKNTSGIARLRLIQWDNGQTIAAGDRWLWTIYINGHVPQIASVPISDHAITLDEAASQFKQSYEAMRTKAGLPRPQR